MAELHVVAAVRTIDIFPLHATAAERAFVTVARDPIEAERGHYHHQQSDKRMSHILPAMVRRRRP
jgi:hypothetical protein